MTEIEYLHERINATVYILSRVANVLVTHLPVVSQEVLDAFNYAANRMDEIENERSNSNAES